MWHEYRTHHMTCAYVNEYSVHFYIFHCFVIRRPHLVNTLSTCDEHIMKKKILKEFIFKQIIYALSETEDLSPAQTIMQSSLTVAFEGQHILFSNFPLQIVQTPKKQSRKRQFSPLPGEISPNKMLIFHKIKTKRKSLSPNRSSGTETCVTESFYHGKILL